MNVWWIVIVNVGSHLAQAGQCGPPWLPSVLTWLQSTQRVVDLDQTFHRCPVAPNCRYMPLVWSWPRRIGDLVLMEEGDYTESKRIIDWKRILVLPGHLTESDDWETEMFLPLHEYDLQQPPLTSIRSDWIILGAFCSLFCNLFWIWDDS